MGAFLRFIEKWLGGGPGGSKRSNTFKWLIIIGLVGVLIMVLNSFINIKQVDPQPQGRASPQLDAHAFADKNDADSKFQSMENKIESNLKDILEKIVGVGSVQVLVTIDSTEEIIVGRNVQDTQQVTNERDQNGANRSITSITKNGEVVMHPSSGDQAPLVLKTLKPKIRGVLVVAKGAENVIVKKLIAEAIERGLEVPAYRISIVPSKQ